jgi:diadenylate cyclase
MNPVLSTQLGTRHRAGIGITEETDAIAVIVSEETGAISLAQGGKIERDLSVEQLRERLSSELRRHMSAVALPTAIPHSEESDDAAEARLDLGPESQDDVGTQGGRP